MPSHTLPLPLVSKRSSNLAAESPTVPLTMACAKGDHGDPNTHEACMIGRAWRFSEHREGDKVLLFLKGQAVAQCDQVCWFGLSQWQCRDSCFFPLETNTRDRSAQGLAMHNEHSVGPIGGDSSLGESAAIELRVHKTNTLKIFTFQRPRIFGLETRKCRTDPSARTLLLRCVDFTAC
jgi:hypothetical protein